MYAQDYDELYPYCYFTTAMTWWGANMIAPSTGPNTYDGAQVYYVLLPYIRNAGIWYCPQIPKSPADHYVDPALGTAATNYEVNCMITMPDYYGPAPNGIGKIPSTSWGSGPVSLGMIADPVSTFFWEDWGQAYTNNAIHNGGTNFGCCDGHAKWIRQGNKTCKGGWW